MLHSVLIQGLHDNRLAGEILNPGRAGSVGLNSSFSTSSSLSRPKLPPAIFSRMPRPIRKSEVGKSMATDSPFEVLLAESDAQLGATIARHLEEHAGVQVTRCRSIAQAVQEELTARHPLLITSTSLPEGDGFQLIHEIRSNNSCPVIFLAEEPTAGEVIAAMRAGVVDVLIKPVDLEYLSRIVKNMATCEHKRRRDQVRNRRLRRVASRIIHERRDLRHQMDLICTDIVQAYRRLAQQVSDTGVLTQQH